MIWNDHLSGEPWYRMLTPRWAISPTSGAGAAKHGGRFNRPGVSALYLSSEPDTACAEYQQDQALMPPGTLVTYQLELGRVVDLRNGYQRGGWDEIWEEWNCSWRALALANTEPPSWLMGDIAIENGAKGILFSSTRHPGGINLVVFTSQLGPEDKLSVYDPRGDLPADQSSWLK
jgi:RES domain-containing protein